MLEQRGLREVKITLLGELDDQCRDTTLCRHPRRGDGLDAVFCLLVQPLGLKGDLDGRLQFRKLGTRDIPVASRHLRLRLRDVRLECLADTRLRLLRRVRHTLLSTRARPIAALAIVGEDYLTTHLRLVSRLVVHAIRLVFSSHGFATCDLAALHLPQNKIQKCTPIHFQAF